MELNLLTCFKALPQYKRMYWEHFPFLSHLAFTTLNPTFITAAPPVLIWLKAKFNLELPDVVVDVVQVGHHHTLVVHHVVQQGQPIAQLGPGLIKLSQRSRFRKGTSCQSLSWNTHTNNYISNTKLQSDRSILVLCSIIKAQSSTNATAQPWILMESKCQHSFPANSIHL